MIRQAVTYRGQNSHALPRRADPPAAFWFLGRAVLRGSISPSVVDALASAIQTQEGYYPGSVAYSNNNPGNLVYAGQAGATPGLDGFAKFSTYDQGLAALKNQITLDATRGTDINGNPTTTPAELLTSWAPPSENDTAAYIASVASQTGFDPNAPLSSLGTSSDYTSSDFSQAVSSAGQDFNGTVDLSSVGLPSDTPWWTIAAGVVGFIFLVRSI